MNRHLFSVSWRSALVLAALLLASLPVAAQEQQTCQVLQNNRWVSVGVMPFMSCAVVISALGAKAGQSEATGYWRNEVTLVRSNGAIYWGQGRKYLGALPDLDRDGFLYEACPTQAETRNKVFDNDGCPDTVNDLLNLAAADLHTFWAREFRRNGWRYAGPSTITPYTRSAPVRTRCGTSIPNNAFFCPADRGIYYDFNWMQSHLLVGDFAPVTVLAHEWGHLVQGLLGADGGSTLSIAKELQADCLAGAYTGYLARGESTTVRLDDDDLEEGAEQTFRAGNPDEDWFDPGAHGTPEQRLRSFDLGFKNGARGCF